MLRLSLFAVLAMLAVQIWAQDIVDSRASALEGFAISLDTKPLDTVSTQIDNLRDSRQASEELFEPDNVQYPANVALNAVNSTVQPVMDKAKELQRELGVTVLPPSNETLPVYIDTIKLPSNGNSRLSFSSGSYNSFLSSFLNIRKPSPSTQKTMTTEEWIQSKLDEGLPKIGKSLKGISDKYSGMKGPGKMAAGDMDTIKNSIREALNSDKGIGDAISSVKEDPKIKQPIKPPFYRFK